MSGGRGKINEYNKSLTPEQRSLQASRAQRARTEKAKRRKAFREVAKDVLDLRLKGTGEVLEADIAKSFAEFGLYDRDMTVRTAIILALTKKALSGNIQAISMLFALTGEDLDNTQRAKALNREARLRNKQLEATIELMMNPNGGTEEQVVIVDDIEAVDADAQDKTE